MKALGLFNVTLKRFWILLQDKKKRKIYNRIPTSPLNRPPNLKLPIHLCFSMLLCRIDETERLHLRKTPKLKNYSLRQSARAQVPFPANPYYNMHGACNHVTATWQSRAGISFIVFTNITIIFFLLLNHWSAVITCLDFTEG